MTASLDVKPAFRWDEREKQDVASLILNPATNGGLDARALGLTGEAVVAALDTMQLSAWGAWRGGALVFLVALLPFNGARGILHVAGTRVLSHAQHAQITRAFLDSHPGVEVYAVLSNPALARLARSVGLVEAGREQGQIVLKRQT